MPDRAHRTELLAKAAFACLAALLAASGASGRARGEPEMKVLARSTAPVVLGSGPVVADLAPAGGPLARELDAMPHGRRLFLVVRGLTAEKPPGTPYSLFLDLPAGAHPGADDPRNLGAISFYNARRPGAPNAPDAESPVNSDAEKLFFSFDVTDKARNLRTRGLLGERTTITLVPERAADPAAKPRIGHLELVEQ